MFEAEVNAKVEVKQITPSVTCLPSGVAASSAADTTLPSGVEGGPALARGVPAATRVRGRGRSTGVEAGLTAVLNAVFDLGGDGLARGGETSGRIGSESENGWAAG